MSGSSEGWDTFDAAMRAYVSEFATLSALGGHRHTTWSSLRDYSIARLTCPISIPCSRLGVSSGRFAVNLVERQHASRAIARPSMKTLRTTSRGRREAASSPDWIHPVHKFGRKTTPQR